MVFIDFTSHVLTFKHFTRHSIKDCEKFSTCDANLSSAVFMSKGCEINFLLHSFPADGAEGGSCLAIQATTSLKRLRINLMPSLIFFPSDFSCDYLLSFEFSDDIASHRSAQALYAHENSADWLNWPRLQLRESPVQESRRRRAQWPHGAVNRYAEVQKHFEQQIPARVQSIFKPEEHSRWQRSEWIFLWFSEA